MSGSGARYQPSSTEPMGVEDHNPGSPARCTPRVKWIVAMTSLAAFIILILVLIIVHIGSQSEVLRDCSGDGFESVDYLIDPSDAESPKRFLAVKIDAKSSRLLFTFPEALAHCQTLGSEVWQVLDGQPEWQAVMDHALKKNQHSVWIHAIPIEPYSTSGDQDQLKARAQEGRGLPIRWPQTREPADYSRFIGGDESEKCVTVKKNEPHLWELTPCDNRYFVACVKRHCQEPK